MMIIDRAVEDQGSVQTVIVGCVGESYTPRRTPGSGSARLHCSDVPTTAHQAMTTTLDHTMYDLEFEERFDGASLDAGRWVAHYLPQWTTCDRSAARYDLVDGVLRLRIDVDQPAWCPDDGELRVSNVQTGSFSGPAGSFRGQHRHRPDLSVVSPQPPRRLYTPSTGLVEASLRATIDSTTMLAFWLIGHEESAPEDSGEICVVELFGDAIGRSSSTLSIGVKAYHDPRLHDDMARLRLDLDATAWHRYAAAWDATEIRFFVDDQLVRVVEQSITYPLQLMLDLFEFPPSAARNSASYPKIGEVRAVRGYRPQLRGSRRSGSSESLDSAGEPAVDGAGRDSPGGVGHGR